MSQTLSPIWFVSEQCLKKTKTNKCQLVSIDLSCLPLFVIEEQPSRPVLFQPSFPLKVVQNARFYSSYLAFLVML